MRLLILLTITVLVLAAAAFLLNNLGKTVEVAWFSSSTQMPLWMVVFIWVGITFLVTAGIGVIEGTANRLENRKLRREVHKLETELNFLRTQPGLRKSKLGLDLGEAVSGASTPPPPQAPLASLPSAPVYDAQENADSDPDDDMYTGGRAV